MDLFGDNSTEPPDRSRSRDDPQSDSDRRRRARSRSRDEFWSDDDADHSDDGIPYRRHTDDPEWRRIARSRSRDSVQSGPDREDRRRRERSHSRDPPQRYSRSRSPFPTGTRDPDRHYIGSPPATARGSQEFYTPENPTFHWESQDEDGPEEDPDEDTFQVNTESEELDYEHFANTQCSECNSEKGSLCMACAYSVRKEMKHSKTGFSDKTGPYHCHYLWADRVALPDLFLLAGNEYRCREDGTEYKVDAYKELSEEERVLSMTDSFSFPTYMGGDIINIDEIFTHPRTNAELYTDGTWTAYLDRDAALASVQGECRAVQEEVMQCWEAAHRASPTVKRPKRIAARREASAQERREYSDKFHEAKILECKSWRDENEVLDLVDMRKQKCPNFITGRWVLTIKRDKEGNFQKCKARWVLRGFQDNQIWKLQTDSPTSTRPGFRMQMQAAANRSWDLLHVDLKTAFLQGDKFSAGRDIVCQLPPEFGVPAHMGGRLKRAAYGLNDAPRLWWNRLDAALRSYGLVPTRADRCCYVLYSQPSTKTVKEESWASHSGDSAALDESAHSTVDANGLDTCLVLKEASEDSYESKFLALSQVFSASLGDTVVSEAAIEKALDLMMDPIHGSKAASREVEGIVTIHVDDCLLTGSSVFETKVVNNLKKDFKVGSEDKNDIEFVGQRCRWIGQGKPGAYIRVDQEKKVEELSEIPVPKNIAEKILCPKDIHTQFRSVLGQINWLQSRTQFQSCYAFSRCASASASPTWGSVRALNKLVRQIRATQVELRFFTLKGTLRIMGYPDAAYRNNEDFTSQRGQCIFLAEARKKGVTDPKASLVDYESQKIKRTVLSTTVAELYAFMKCYGTCLFLRGLWMDLTGTAAELHMRTDANNLVTTASTTHLPEQKETIHMINQLRTEASSGSIDDLAHVVSADMMADCLTKNSANPIYLLEAIRNGVLPRGDINPPFRELMSNRHRAYYALSCWIVKNLERGPEVITFLGEDIRDQIAYCVGIRIGWIREVDPYYDDQEKNVGATHFLKTQKSQEISVCNLQIDYMD